MTTITQAQIDVALPPGPARDRAMARVHAHELEQRARAFREAVLAGDHEHASELFMTEVGHLERKAFLMYCEGDEVVDFAKHASRDVVEAILAVHNNPSVIRRALIPDAEVAPMVIVTSRVNQYAIRRTLSPTEVHRLREAGAEAYIMAPERQTWGYEGSEPDRYRWRGIGLDQGGSFAMQRTTWDAIVAIDGAIADCIANGMVTVEAMSIEEARARIPVKGGQKS